MKKGYRDLSEEKIKQKTGKSFKIWKKILDKFNVKDKGHTLTAKHLREKYGLNDWWAQVITVKYEFERGLGK